MIIKRKRLRRVGLVAEHRYDEGSGQVVVDHSPSGNHLQLGSTTGADINDPSWAGGGLTYDGSNDYCRQEVIVSQLGNLYGSMINGTAFLIDDGQDFSSYVRANDGRSSYAVVAEDGSGNQAFGYLGEEGASETLGSELVTTNAGFETYAGVQDDGNTDSFTDWIVGGGVLAGNTVEATATSHAGSNAVKQAYAAPSDFPRISRDFTVSGGGLYKLEFWTRGNGVAAGTYEVYDNTHSAVITGQVSTGITGTTYTLKTVYVTTPAGCISVRVYFRVGIFAGNINYFDDISFKQVLTPPATTGIVIYSTAIGTTQNWALIEAGFNANNDIVSYEIRRAGLNFDGAGQNFSVLAAFKLTDLTNDQEIAGRWSATDGQWRLAFDETDDYIKISVVDGAGMQVAYSAGSSVVVDDWVIVGGVAAAGTLWAYIDGLVSGSTDTYADLEQITAPMQVGGYGTSVAVVLPMTGVTGYLAIFSRGIMPAEMARATHIIRQQLRMRGVDI